MDYSNGALHSMCSNFFPKMRKELGPYLVDKTKLIEKIVDGGRLNGVLILFFDPDAVGSPPCYKCSSNHVGLYRLSVLKLFDQFFFPSPSRW